MGLCAAVHRRVGGRDRNCRILRLFGGAEGTARPALKAEAPENGQEDTFGEGRICVEKAVLSAQGVGAKYLQI